MALDVKININSIKPVGRVGFGCPLILECNAAAGTDYTEVSSLSELLKIGVTGTNTTPTYGTDSVVYKAAQLMFMQEHAPKKIAVASCTTAATDWLAVEANVSKGWRQLVVVGENVDATANAAIMAARS